MAMGAVEGRGDEFLGVLMAFRCNWIRWLRMEGRCVCRKESLVGAKDVKMQRDMVKGKTYCRGHFAYWVTFLSLFAFW